MPTPTSRRRPAYFRLYQCRRGGQPIVGARVAGMCWDSGHGPGIYRSNSSTSGELGPAYWYRQRESERGISRADCWRICISAGLRYAEGRARLADVYLDAVIDDFGDLVVVPRAPQQ